MILQLLSFFSDNIIKLITIPCFNSFEYLDFSPSTEAMYHCSSGNAKALFTSLKISITHFLNVKIFSFVNFVNTKSHKSLMETLSYLFSPVKTGASSILSHSLRFSMYSSYFFPLMAAMISLSPS